ncbi:MAG: hypothetical protein LBF15_06715 [Candidatus Peribacteria bacterium]|nr:hypothetical protein [Candidatus Peribacteria bacterium]
MKSRPHPLFLEAPPCPSDIPPPSRGASLVSLLEGDVSKADRGSKKRETCIL